MPPAYSTHERFLRDLEKLFVAPPGSLHGDLPLNGLKGWDSLGILEFMVLASEYGRELQPTDLARCSTVADLASLVLTTETPAGTPAGTPAESPA